MEYDFIKLEDYVYTDVFFNSSNSMCIVNNKIYPFVFASEFNNNYVKEKLKPLMNLNKTNLIFQ